MDFSRSARNVLGSARPAGPLSGGYFSIAPPSLLRAPSSNLEGPGGGRLSSKCPNPEGSWLRLDSEAVSMRDTGFHRVVGGGGWCSRGGCGGLGEMRGGGAPKCGWRSRLAGSW